MVCLGRSGTTPLTGVVRLVPGCGERLRSATAGPSVVLDIVFFRVAPGYLRFSGISV